MNPVLLKPQSDGGGADRGRRAGSWRARRRANTAAGAELLPACSAAFARLAEAADLVLVEGAGSPAEINLRDGDIANMGFAEAADVPVVLVGDIERGGVIAQLVGTHALLSPERAGADRRLRRQQVPRRRAAVRRRHRRCRRRTGLRCFGVVPYFPAAALLPAEDSLALRPTHSTAPR